MSDNLGRSVTRGLAWSGLESFGGAALTLATTMILARLVTPEDYGLIAVLQIVLTIGMLLVESGFSSAFIRLKEKTKRHESTVLAFNLSISAVIYTGIFFVAPLISSFYNNSSLTSISRIYALVIPLNALCVVQHARLSASMQFGKILTATGSASVISSLFAIWLAFEGMGVWALVYQQIMMWGTRGLFLWLLQWRSPVIPRIYGKEFKQLFDFGWKLLFSSLINSFGSSIYSFIIGKVFTIFQAGLFSKASTLASFPAQNGTDAIQRVSYPALCKLTDDPKQFTQATLRLMRMSMWIMLPVMLCLAFLSPQCVLVILGEQWVKTTPYFVLLCLAFSLYPIHSINLNILKVFGRSDIFLRLEIIKVSCSIALMVAGIVLYGIEGVCISMIFFSLICVPINGYKAGKYSGVNVKNQFGLLLPIVFFSLIASTGSYFIARLIQLPLLSLLTGLISGAAIYLLLSLFAFPNNVTYFRKSLNYLFSRKNI